MNDNQKNNAISIISADISSQLQKMQDEEINRTSPYRLNEELSQIESDVKLLRKYVDTLLDGLKRKEAEMKDKLQKMIGKRPTDLDGETLKLFNAIMEIADDNDKLREQIAEMDSDYERLEREYKKLEEAYEKVKK